MIGPSPVAEPHSRSLLKRKLPPTPPEVEDVCSYETIYELLGEGPGGLTSLVGSPASLEASPASLEASPASLEASPASLESGYQTSPRDQDASDEDSNLTWLLNFKVSSLFDPAEDRPPPKPHTNCACSGAGPQRSGPAKPPFTYTELIEKALKEQGQLTVSGIYTWISSNYPYYNPGDDRWKNSVRHNLSINPHFRKGVKSRHGAGHLWTLSNEGVNPPPDSWKRTRTTPPSYRTQSPLLDEAAVAVANIMKVSPPPSPQNPPAPASRPHQDQGLHRVAEEILSGVKRQVEVQYLVHERITNDGITSADLKQEDEEVYLTYEVNPPCTPGVLYHPDPLSLETQLLGNTLTDPPPNSLVAAEAEVVTNLRPPDLQTITSSPSFAPIDQQPLSLLSSGCDSIQENQILPHPPDDLNEFLFDVEHVTKGACWTGAPDHTIIVTVPQNAPFSSSCLPSQPPIEFLNPVSKEELVSESGLDTSHCEATSSLLTELGSELHLPDNLFTDDLAFTCYSHL